MPTVEYSSSYSVSYWGSISAQVRLSFSESYNQATNTTTLTLTGIEFKKDGSSSIGSIPVYGTVSVNGTTVCMINNTSGHISYVSLDGSGWCSANLSNISITPVAVVHNDDGSKTVTVSLDAGVKSRFCAQYTWTHQYATAPQTGHALYRTDYVPFGVYAPTSASMALTTRARGSSISSSSSSVATQGTYSLAVSRNSSSYYHKATFKIGSTTMATSSAFAKSLSYTVPRTWFNSYPTDTSKTVTVSVQTYTDSSCTTAVGSAVTTTFTMTADSGMKPTVTSGWASLAYYNTGTAASGISGYVKGYSKAQVTFNAAKITHANGASLSSYSVTCQGSTDSSSPYLTPVLNSTSVSVVCTVTDTRGRSTSQTFTLTVMDYSKPSLSGISVYRCDSNGTADEDGTSYSVKATRSFSSLNGANSCSLVCARAASGGSYGSNTTLTSGKRKIISGISADTSYTVRIKATDSLGNSAVYYAAIPTRKWAMKFRSDGNGVAFGKAAETDNTFEVSSDWDVKFGRPLPIASGGTDATTATDACANLKAFDLDVTANAVASGDNLNDYKTVGTYICATSAIANNLNQHGNCPTARAFKMIVMHSISNTYLLQIIYDYRGEAMWQRWYNSSWSAWCKYSCDVASSDTVNTTYGGVTETGGCVVRRRGNVVQCEISHGNGTTFSGLTGIDSICTIPSGYKPTATMILPIVARDNGVWASANYVTAILRVTSTGAAEIRYNKNVMGTMKYITGTVTWLTDG